MIDPRAPRMMPGQEPYTQEELDRLYAAVADAADGDPGEEGEAEVLAEFSRREIDAMVAAEGTVDR